VYHWNIGSQNALGVALSDCSQLLKDADVT
jgi:hypothetical protein